MRVPRPGRPPATTVAAGDPVSFEPLTESRWADLEALFGTNGACAGCWCMWWRQTRTEFESSKGEKNRRALKAIVRSGESPEIIAYAGGRPAGWCFVAPREAATRLERSRVLRRVDEQRVWSVLCFFVGKPFRRRGLTEGLLGAALRFARERGARIVEGYPVDRRKGPMPDVFAYMGFAHVFRKAGFKEVARRSETRPIMRITFGKPPA